jgi:hypothetical protein
MIFQLFAIAKFSIFSNSDLGVCVMVQNKREPKDLWQEPLVPASSWTPCSDQRSWEPNGMCV